MVQMDDLLADFVAETREMLEAIEGELVAWEADPVDRSRLDSIFRFVHTVKGNCGFFDFPRLEKLSHAAESVLAEVRAGRRQPNARLVTAVLAVIDRIMEMTNIIEAGEDLPDDDSDNLLIGALEGRQEDFDELTALQAADSTTKSIDPSAASRRSIRLPVELLDRVMSGVSDMVLARNDLSRRLRDAGNEPTLDGPFERLSGILADVREAITRMRMQRIELLYNALPRLVRDLSAELGKQVMVDFEGGDVELDREMIEMIRDPITHLIRNAIDHGIETPSMRLAQGKREIGMLSIASRQSGNQITMVITDDGAGLNEAKIGAKALAAGLVTQSELEAMSSDEIVNLIFEPGLSTADEVSEISGRGVGMDVVRSNIEQIGGRISVSSEPGKGAQFFLELPLTLSIISALTVSIDGQYFAIPNSYIEEIAHGASASVDFSEVGDRDLVTFRGQRIPCLTLNNVLDVAPRSAGSDQRLILLRLGGSDIFALAVDRIHDQEDLVIKPLSPAVMATQVYAGTTLLDDGRPVLMLDIPAIAASHGLVSDIRQRSVKIAQDPADAAMPTGRTLMTFVDLDGRRRAIGMELVSRIDQVERSAFDIEGERAQVVVDNTIVELAGKLKGALPDGLVKLLRLSDSQTGLAYPIAELGETVEYSGTMAPADADPVIEGVALIDGLPVPIIDGYHLFAAHGQAPVEPEVQLVCRLPEGDEWVNRMLAPLAKAAGYRLTNDQETDADVVIVTSATATNTPHEQDKVITLLNDPSETANKSGIYRYDRAAIVEALTTARKRSAS
jgi:two-component system chemotaxis sensor kinase CheA